LIGERDDILLRTKGLVKSFGALIAVDRVDFTLPKYEIRAVIGPNGAGKTTFFNLLTGHLNATGGEIIFKGKNIIRLSPAQISHIGIARSFQTVNIFPNFSAFGNIRIAVQSRRRFQTPFTPISNLKEVNQEAHTILKMLGLEEKSDIMATNLSHGEQRHLEIGIALATEPVLLLLDEPTAGMSPGETADTAKLIKRIANEKNLTIIIVEHDMSVVMEVADTITVFNQGRIVAEGSPEAIRENEEVRKAYLKGG
jgi:branched-chain amino acid transport system ATP-binding protein